MRGCAYDHAQGQEGMKRLPALVVAKDGTKIYFWHIPKGTAYGKNSQRVGATLVFPDNRPPIRAWGTNLRRWLNNLPGVPPLNKLLKDANKSTKPANTEEN